MTDKELIIDWIHRVEYIPKSKAISKRLSGIVTELFFEKSLYNRAELDLPKPISLGWAYKFDTINRRRVWFKFSEKGVHSKICRAFINLVKATNQKDIFYLVQSEIRIVGSAPDIKWIVHEVIIEGNDKFRLKKTAESEKICSQIQGNVTYELRLRNAINAENTFRDWLNIKSTDELEWIFSVRCLMNFSKLYLSDIDAIGINEKNILEIIEFKRKYPASGMRHKLTTNNGNSIDIHNYLSEIENLDQNKAKSEIYAELVKQPKWEVVRGNSFGLDTSHAYNVELCIRANINYRYIIWNSRKTNITELFSENFKPNDDIELCTLNVSSQDFDGISYTSGDDCGTYKKSIRFQLMIPINRFIPSTITKNKF